MGRPFGAIDPTLVRFVQPGWPFIRTINPGKIFRSIYERPIYFLRSHEGYHFGWCEKDDEVNWLSLWTARA